MELDDALAEICSRHMLDAGLGATVVEPYIPFVPAGWNGVLVLAEAQNHGAASADYLAELRAMTSAERIRRLKRGERVRIQPWDDGSLKLAVEAACGVKASETAVSNAVLWSQVDPGGRNATPSDALIHRSIPPWAEMLAVLRPQRIVTAGNIAETVIDGALHNRRGSATRVKLRLPSPQAISRISGMFEVDDLLTRYPEVRTVVDAHPEWVATHRRNKIFFACHAVSVMCGRAWTAS